MNKNKIQSVKFLPWVGENYEYGIKGYDDEGHVIYGTKDDPGRKILALGESHYISKEEVDKNITINIITYHIDPNAEFEYFMNTYTKLERTLSGHRLNTKEKKDFWNHIMYFNYLQEPMKSTRLNPTLDQYKSSEESFWEILSRYAPNIVIVLGTRLFNNLPHQGKEGLFFLIDETLIECWEYEVNKQRIDIIPIRYPSAGYDWVFWNKAISHVITQ